MSTPRQLLSTFVISAIVGAAGAPAFAHDCREGFQAVRSFSSFHRADFAGQLAIAPRASSPAQARAAQIFCVFSADTVVLRPHGGYLYFVFNNMVRDEEDPQERLPEFLGIEVVGYGARQDDKPIQLKKYRSELWAAEGHALPRKRAFTRTEATQVVADAAPTTLFAALGAPPLRADMSEQQFEQKYQVDWHGTIKRSRMRDGQEQAAPDLRTWDARDSYRALWRSGSSDAAGQDFAMLKAEVMAMTPRTGRPNYRNAQDVSRRVVFGYNVAGLDRLTVRLLAAPTSDFLGRRNEFTINLIR